jgi:hypothetical protein
MNTLTLYRNASPSITVPINESTFFTQKLMTEHRISCDFFSTSVLDIQIGDYVTHSSENFYINRIPSITKLSNHTLQYHIDFESVLYELTKKLFISTDGLAEYGYTGNASNFITNIVANMNVSGMPGGWTVGTVDSTDEKTIVFSNESCRSALVKVAETFALEFSITTKSISLIASVGSVTTHTFEYGKDNGLYKLTREQVSDQNIITRVYGFGSTANIPYTYRDRAKRLIFEERYLEKNVDIYGVIEGQYTNNDIFPNRTGSVTAVNMLFEDSVYNNRDSYIEDTTINFDISVAKIDGASGPPSIVFKSGDLSGQEFEIWKYDSATHRIYFNQQSDEDGYTTPNLINVPIVSDLYTLINIALPQAYIDDAETALENATQAFLDENSVPMVVYSVDIDPKYARDNTIHLKAGDRVTIIDSALGINNLVRVSQVDYPLTNEYKIKAVIADHVPYTQQERVIQNTVNTINETRIVDRTSDELARRNAMRQRQLLNLVFDSDGYFDGTRIRPLSVETMYLSVGAKSQNFRLVGVTIMVNYLGDPNRLYCSTGELHHFEIPDEDGFDWIIGSAYDTGAGFLDPNQFYYLYAKCYKASSSAEWELSIEKLMADGLDGYYHFLVGVIYDVYDGVRDYDLTYGMTYINGRTITTGKIQSLDELAYLDLTEGTFRLGDVNGGLDWNVTYPNTLTLHGHLIQRQSGDVFPVTVFRGVYSPTTLYEYGDVVTYGGASWIYHNETPVSGITPVEGAYWTLQGGIGATGATGASPMGMFRGEWNAGTDYYGTSSRVDIVYYTPDELYYVAKPTAGNPFRGQVPSLTSDYWNSFGANFESVATSLLFAETAYLDNVVVRQFEGLPVGVGSLTGSVTATQANVAGTPRIDYIDLTGSSGQASIVCNLVTRTAVFDSDLATTAMNFVADYYSDYYSAGVQIHADDDRITFAEINGYNFSGATDVTNISGELDGSSGILQTHVAGQKRIDTITLSETGGTADITCDGLTKRCIYNDSLTATASGFVTAYASAYLAGGVVVTSDGADIIFTAQYAGQNFTGDTTIVNVPGLYAGAISIEGNDIWDNITNSNDAGILINMKGYNGGYSYYRAFYVGNGHGSAVKFGVGHDNSTNKDAIWFNAEQIQILGIPHSSSGLAGNVLYVDANGFLKLAGY